MTSSTVARQPGEELDRIFESIPPDAFATMVYPDFRVRCIASLIPPRDVMFDHLLDASRNDVDRVFSGASFRGKRLRFIFPERWMSVAEQGEFMNRLAAHPGAKGLEVVDILTACPTIVTDIPNDSLRVLDRSGGTHAARVRFGARGNRVMGGL